MGHSKHHQHVCHLTLYCHCCCRRSCQTTRGAPRSLSCRLGHTGGVLAHSGEGLPVCTSSSQTASPSQLLHYLSSCMQHATACDSIAFLARCCCYVLLTCCCVILLLLGCLMSCASTTCQMARVGSTQQTWTGTDTAMMTSTCSQVSSSSSNSRQQRQQR